MKLLCFQVTFILMILGLHLCQATQVADLVWKKGRVYTGDVTKPKDQRWAEAVAVKNGKIIYVGTDAGVQGYITSKTKVLDLCGRLVLAGFHDSHAHPLESGNSMTGTCRLKGKVNPETFIPLLKECAPKQKGTNWVLGAGHSFSDFTKTSRSPVAILDEAIPDRPAYMLEETSHSAWVNTKALEALGYTKDTPDPPGGFFGKDKLGKLNGILFENAAIIAFAKALSNPTQEMKNYMYDGLIYGATEMNKWGVTAVADARVFWVEGHQDIWKKAETKGELTIRGILGLWAYPELQDDDQLTKLGNLFNTGSDMVKITQVKMYVDGIIGQGTAALVKPYKFQPNPKVGLTGFNYFDQTRLTKYVTALDKIGFDMHLHTIGDRASLEALNAIESATTKNGAARVRDRRHRLTHLELILPAQWPRFKRIGAIADMQLNGDFTDPSNYKEEFEDFIGDRYKIMLPLRSLWDTGATVTLSSDWDVSPISPFLGIHRALSKGNESLTDVYDAVQAYTLNGAYLMRLEKKTGSIEVGKYADMIIADQNIFDRKAVSIDSIKSTKVLLTLLGGKEVYRSSTFIANSGSSHKYPMSCSTYIVLFLTYIVLCSM